MDQQSLDRIKRLLLEEYENDISLRHIGFPE